MYRDSFVDHTLNGE